MRRQVYCQCVHIATHFPPTRSFQMGSPSHILKTVNRAFCQRFRAVQKKTRSRGGGGSDTNTHVASCAHNTHHHPVSAHSLQHRNWYRWCPLYLSCTTAEQTTILSKLNVYSQSAHWLPVEKLIVAVVFFFGNKSDAYYGIFQQKGSSICDVFVSLGVNCNKLISV